MLTYIFYYVSIGVLLNFLFDLVVNYIEQEEARFTTVERISTTLLWPIALGVFLFNFFKTLNGK